MLTTLDSKFFGPAIWRLSHGARVASRLTIAASIARVSPRTVQRLTDVDLCKRCLRQRVRTHSAKRECDRAGLGIVRRVLELLGTQVS